MEVFINKASDQLQHVTWWGWRADDPDMPMKKVAIEAIQFFRKKYKVIPDAMVVVKTSREIRLWHPKLKRLHSEGLGNYKTLAHKETPAKSKSGARKVSKTLVHRGSGLSSKRRKIRNTKRKG